MKVAYLFISPLAVSLNAAINIISQLENSKHSLEVVGMCFFDENSLLLNLDHPLGLRLCRLGKNMQITLMISTLASLADKNGTDNSASGSLKNRSALTPSQRPVITISNGVETACLPDIYAALSAKPPDRLISV